MLRKAIGLCCLVFACNILVLAGPVATAAPGEPVSMQFDSESLPIPYQRFTTQDCHRRTITAYLSRGPKEAKGPLPIVLWIQGSGCQSLFGKNPQGQVGGGLQNLLYKMAEGRYRVLCVEKPGVKYLDAPPRPGSAQGATEEFLQEHTLPRWAEANVAALRAVWSLPEIDPSRTLVLGHSEGALTAARVAAELPQVTHVAPLASAGPTQLYSLAELAAQARHGDQPGDSERRREAVFTEWQKILADPDSTAKSWMGHPYRRWSTFCKHNSVTELLRSKAKIYLAQGTEDKASFIGELDVLRAELAVQGRDVVVERVSGADHGFRTVAAAEKEPGPPQFEDLFKRILTWFMPK